MSDNYRCYDMSDDIWKIKWYHWLYLWLYHTEIYRGYDGILVFKDVRGIRYMLDYYSNKEIREFKENENNKE